jgi:hypothetical protein
VEQLVRCFLYVIGRGYTPHDTWYGSSVKPTRGLVLGLMFGGSLVSACGDVHLSLQPTAAIEVLNEAGESHLSRTSSNQQA